jgi:hypothetical protein
MSASDHRRQKMLVASFLTGTICLLLGALSAYAVLALIGLALLWLLFVAFMGLLFFAIGECGDSERIRRVRFCTITLTLVATWIAVFFGYMLTHPSY